MKHSRRRHFALTLGLALFVSTASQAVIIYFKDGSKEIIADRYRVDGNRVIAVLQSGQETAIPLAAVDLEKTEAMSKMVRGSAKVIDRVQDEEAAALKQARTVADLMRERSTLPTPAPLAENTSRSLRYTPAGNVDFLGSTRRQLTPPARAALIESLLEGHGLEAAAAYQGTEANRVLIDIVTGTRGEVYEALKSSAAVLLELRRAWPEVRGLELAMATGTRSRAGQFVLTPEQAELLASGGTTPAEYFVANVLF
jgi:hypothetical protein